MSTNVNLLEKGLKQLGLLIFLLILSPICLTMGFKDLKKFTESPEKFIAYGILFIGFSLIIFTILFAFKAFKTLLNAFFKSN